VLEQRDQLIPLDQAPFAARIGGAILRKKIGFSSWTIVGVFALA
jgi:hypothetical protein